MFIPLILICAVSDPNQCMAYSGPMTDSVKACQVEIAGAGIPQLYKPGENFVAEVKCVEFEYQLPGEAI